MLETGRKPPATAVASTDRMTRFILLGLDGACPDIIAKATDEGLMPNFARLRAMGCWADNIPFPPLREHD